MTRKGDKERPWTVADERYLAEHAGIDSVRSICRELKRSRRSVEVKASRMHVSLRHWERLTAICPRCGEARSRSGRWMDRTGFCEVCAKRDAYDEALRRQAEAYEALPPEWRAVYDASEARTGASQMPGRPPAPQLFGLPEAKARRLSDLHAIEVEKWELDGLKLKTDAVKKRTQRMREKTGTNPRRFRGGQNE